MRRSEKSELFKDFQAAAARPIRNQIDNGFILTYKPVLDDAAYRSFKTMREYRRWCETKLPKWLGYGKGL